MVMSIVLGFSSYLVKNGMAGWVLTSLVLRPSLAPGRCLKKELLLLGPYIDRREQEVDIFSLF